MAGRRHRIASVIVQRLAVPDEDADAEDARERTTVEPEREGVS